MRRTRLSRFHVLLGFTAAYFIILGAKWALIRAFGSDVPYWDQWYAEGQLLYLPFLGRSLSWSALFALGNEHRMFFSRVLSLALLALDGQWDGQLQTVVNAVIHTSVVVATGVMLWRVCGRRFPILIVLLVAATNTLPFAYENTLWGFQSCFYFLIGFGVLTIWLLSVSRPLSGPWFVGCCTAVCGLFTMASGLLAPAAVLALSAFRWFRGREGRRGVFATAAVCLALTVAGMVLLAGAKGDATLRAATALDFLGALGKALAWPYVTLPWVAIIAWLPSLILLVQVMRGKRSDDDGAHVLLGLGAWIVLQAAAMAYSRGAGAPRPVSRYMDILSLGTVVNGIAVAVVARNSGQPDRRWLGKLLPSVWFVWFVAGLGGASWYVWRRSLPKYAAERETQARSVRAFVETDDSSFLTSGGLRSIPSSSAEALAFYLRNPEIRSILPVSVRVPLPIARDGGGDSAFVLNGFDPVMGAEPGERSWGSYAAGGAPRRGTFESTAIAKTTLPYLQFEVAGFLGQKGLSLALKAGDGEHRLVTPDARGKGPWRKATVARPRRAFAVVATDDSERYWFAFREPREMGRLSFWSSALAARALWLALCGVVSLLAVLVWAGRGAAARRGLSGWSRSTKGAT